MCIRQIEYLPIWIGYVFLYANWGREEQAAQNTSLLYTQPRKRIHFFSIY